MSIYLGTELIKNIRIGDQIISEFFLGSESLSPSQTQIISSGGIYNDGVYTATQTSNNLYYTSEVNVTNFTINAYQNGDYSNFNNYIKIPFNISNTFTKCFKGMWLLGYVLNGTFFPLTIPCFSARYRINTNPAYHSQIWFNGLLCNSFDTPVTYSITSDTDTMGSLYTHATTTLSESWNNNDITYWKIRMDEPTIGANIYLEYTIDPLNNWTSITKPITQRLLNIINKITCAVYLMPSENIVEGNTFNIPRIYKPDGIEIII